MQSHLDTLDRASPTRLLGSVVETNSATAAVADFAAPVGSIVSMTRSSGGEVRGEVIGFQDRRTIVFPYGNLSGVRRGAQVTLLNSIRQLRVGPELVGRILNAHGHCIDGRPQPMLAERAILDRRPPAPADRPRIDQPFATGVKTIDAFVRCGVGQRLGIFAGAGVGKSVLLGMLSKHTQADVNVIALVGERGRELNEFIQRDLGPEGLARSIIVCATSDEPAIVRLQAAYTATSIAEHLRDQGSNVMLLVDSVTRFATAQREIGLATGEPPTTRGYPPSMFATLPKLVERAGRNQAGSITAFYSVLVEGDDPTEPVADTMRGLLDGHLWLSRDLASQGHYPAIDVLESLSRLMNDISPPEVQAAAQIVRQLLAAYRENRDLITVGAYRKGSDKLVDAAIALREPIELFCQQTPNSRSTLDETTSQLVSLAQQCQALVTAPPAAGPALSAATAATGQAPNAA